MEIVHSCCCGMDVHKKTVVACLLSQSGKEVKTFGTMTADLLAMNAWLREQGCQMVAMESTGSYWKPIYNLLEADQIPAMVVNAQHIKAVPGRKTDVKDAEWHPRGTPSVAPAWVVARKLYSRASAAGVGGTGTVPPEPRGDALGGE